MPAKAYRSARLGVTLFIAGFTVVFVAVTILGGTFGYLLLQYANVLTRVFGVVIIALGLMLSAIAIATLRCSCTDRPVTRRARIFPRSEMNFRKVAVSL